MMIIRQFIGGTGELSYHSADIVLKPQWQLYKVVFDSLRFFEDANTDPNISWDLASRSIKRIEFNSLESDTVHLWPMILL
jgi:hypothetical protein